METKKYCQVPEERALRRIYSRRFCLYFPAWQVALRRWEAPGHLHREKASGFSPDRLSPACHRDTCTRVA